ncbi:hypothetical protein ACFLTD_03980, partial [Elusimicrobiota bacterium]
MPIINLEAIAESRKVRLSNIMNVFFVLLIFAAVVNYFGNDILSIAGVLLLVGSMFLVEFLFLKTFNPQIFNKPSRILLIKLIIIMMILFLIIIENTGNLPSYVFPVGAAAILLTILISPFVAAINIFAIAVFSSMTGDFSLANFFVAIAGGLAGIYSARNVRNRNSTKNMLPT